MVFAIDERESKMSFRNSVSVGKDGRQFVIESTVSKAVWSALVDCSIVFDYHPLNE